MKKIFTILGFLFAVSSFAQNNDIVNALKEADASKFSSYFSNTLDVKLPKKNEMKSISKSDAAEAVSDFFSGNHITGFELISQREMSGTMYIAGKLSAGQQSYNITVMLKNNSIITVRIS